MNTERSSLRAPSLIRALLALQMAFAVSCGDDGKKSSAANDVTDAGLGEDVAVPSEELGKDEIADLSSKATITGATQVDGEIPVASVGAKDSVSITTYDEEKAAYAEADTSLDYVVETKSDEQVDGTYVKVEGATTYWDVPVDKTRSETKQVSPRAAQSLLMRLPRVRKNGRFCLRFAVHTTSGIVSEQKRTCLVIPESVRDDLTFVDNLCGGLSRCFQQEKARCVATVLSRAAFVRAFQTQCGPALRAAGTCLSGLTRCTELQYLRMPPDDPTDFRCSTPLATLARCTRSMNKTWL